MLIFIMRRRNPKVTKSYLIEFALHVQNEGGKVAS